MTTFDADYLIPVLVDDVVPGDTVNCNMHFFARLATPLYPIMDNLRLESFFFFVPYRLVWENWTKMHGEQDNPGDSIDFTTPIVASGRTVSTGEIADYFGLPVGLTTASDTISALPFRALRLIWNDWFRDQNLQNKLTVNIDNGPDSTNVGWGTPYKRGKRFDYFTSCLTAPQKGDAVSIPLGTTADIFTAAGAGVAPEVYSTAVSDFRRMIAPSPVPSWVDIDSVGGVSDANKLYADLSTATAATINDLRLAFQTQRLLERDARSGTRYNELILSHFGVTVPDFRLQRPEFLGGGSTSINITAVAQTSGQPTPAANDKLGELAAIGTVSGQHGFTKSFVEHGVLIGLVNVRADITYSQGVERYWTKQTRYDFYYPVLSQIGEQAVLNQEIYHQNVAGTGASQDQGVFGYQERYAEMRYKPSRLTGLFAVDASSNLDEWHLSEDFSSLPTLGDTFIQANTSGPLDRAIQIPSEPQFLFDAYFDYMWARPMPLFGVPGNLDRF
jgi:hypothetical protein